MRLRRESIRTGCEHRPDFVEGNKGLFRQKSGGLGAISWQRIESEGAIKILIGMLSGASAICEIFGTVTVWRNYKLTSDAAQTIAREMNRAEQTEAAAPANPNERLFDQTYIKREPHLERLEKNFVRSAITLAMTPLLPSRITRYGLWAYILGALLGFVAALLAIS